ncbi:MAG: zinc dependent phospholipase C family protein [Ruminococcus sp.]|nr:zinc dependent phospholipase C family protein [Ruminococcus sp.]
MPTSVTHNYFAKDILKGVRKNITNSFKNKLDIYELFTIGFDPFFTSERLPFHEKMGDLCHQNYTDIYFLNYIKIIKEEHLEKEESVLAALYGHLTHYVLDSVFHPFVMYKSGEYDKRKPETRKYAGLHHKMETQIDVYMYENREHKKYKNFKIHNLIPKIKFDYSLMLVLNRNYKEVFHIEKGGLKYQKSLFLVHNGYKYVLEDKLGLKKKLFRQIDKLTPNKSLVLENLSQHVTKVDEKIFNLEHKTWYNPWDNNIKSNESFFELYDKALKIGIELFEATYKYINNKIKEEDYKKVLKDKSYVSGLSWHIKKDLEFVEF